MTIDTKNLLRVFTKSGGAYVALSAIKTSVGRIFVCVSADKFDTATRRRAGIIQETFVFLIHEQELSFDPLS